MNRRSICEVAGDKTGSALLTIVVFFLFFLILLMASFTIVQGNVKRSAKVSEFEASYFVAETGLNEYRDVLGSWLDENHNDYSTSPANLVSDFLSYLGVGVDGSITKAYDDLNGKPAHVTLEFRFLGLVEGVPHYVLESSGTLGNSTRVVASKLSYKQSQSKSGVLEFDANALYLLDFDSTTPITPTNTNNTFEGPIITNKVFELKHELHLIGPVVTNNLFDIQARIRFDGVLISGDRVLARNISNATMHALVLKPGGTLSLNMISNARLDINYLLIPIGTHFDDVVSYENRNQNKSIWESLKQRVIYYQPKNFDPFDLNMYQNLSVLPEVIFENPHIHYDQYFSNDFVLDNEASIQKYVPEVVLPPMPNLNAYPMYSQLNSSPYLNGNVLNVTTNYSQEDRIILDQSYSFEGLHLMRGWGEPLILDIGNRNISLVTKSLRMSGTVKVVGSGSLRIYVIGENDIVNQSHLDLGFLTFNIQKSLGEPVNDASKLMIFVNETNHNGNPLTVTIGTSSSGLPFNGTIYATNLNAQIKIPYHGAYIAPHATKVVCENNGLAEIRTPLIFLPKGFLDLQGKYFEGLVIAKNIQFGTFGPVHFASSFDQNTLSQILEPIVIMPPSGDGSPTEVETEHTFIWGSTIEGGEE